MLTVDEIPTMIRVLACPAAIACIVALPAPTVHAAEPTATADALIVLASEIADLDAVERQQLPAALAPAEPASALRASGKDSDDPIFFVSLVDACATERKVSVDVHTALPADVTLRVYDDHGRTFADKRIERVMGDRTVTASAELRRGRKYWIAVTAQGPRNSTSKPPRQRIVSDSACP